MSKLNAMLDYQKNDIELRKIFKTISDSDDSKRQERAKEAFDKAKTVVGESEITAKTINGFYDKALNFCKETEPKIDELVKALEKAKDPKEEEEVIKKLFALRGRIVDIDKRAGKDKSAGEQCLFAYTDAQAKGHKARTIYNESKARVDASLKENSNQIDRLKALNAKLEKQVDSEFLERYKTLASDKKFPPLVPVSGKSCGGCGMQMSISCLTAVEKQDYGKCDNCRRMVYKG